MPQSPNQSAERQPPAAMRRSASAPMLRRASGSYGSLSELADAALGAFEDDGNALEVAEGAEGEGEAGGVTPAPPERKKGACSPAQAVEAVVLPARPSAPLVPPRTC